MREYISQFEAAMSQLQKSLAQPKDEFVRDSAIQRFEFTFELFWKMLKEYAAFQGFEVRSPRESVQKAFALGIIEDEELFLAMLESRNLAAHTYHEAMAEDIYGRLSNYAGAMIAVAQLMKRQ
ncbi:MAG: HI0074 family nucleotidyltransferase substrate-binding subunit [Ignavibacteriales bacterium]|nr:HI0074 family nucleotidyltransferase substrate-binding subunit [Ignavibacteriales bacterium]